MQVSTLVCDFCRLPRDAVASVVLHVGGRRKHAKRPSADLCEKHLEALERMFATRWRSQAGLPLRDVEPGQHMARLEQHRESDRVRYRKKSTTKEGVVRTYTEASFAKARATRAQKRQDREHAILATLRHADHRMARPELDKVVGLTLSQTAKVLRGLVAAGQVTRHGVGPHAKYELASKARHGSDEHAA